jgi:hypothetical protein
MDTGSIWLITQRADRIGSSLVIAEFHLKDAKSQDLDHGSDLTAAQAALSQILGFLAQTAKNLH